MAVDVQIKLLTDIDQSLREIQKFQKQTTDSFEKSQKAASSFSQSLKNIGEIAAGILVSGLAEKAFEGFVDIMKEGIGEAEQFTQSMISLQSTAVATGNDFENVTKIAEKLSKDGLIQLNDSAIALRNLLESGISADKAEKALLALRDAAAFNRKENYDLAGAIKTATEGIKEQNAKMITAAGVTGKANDIYERYARTLGKVASDLTEQERRQALVNNIIEKGAQFQGNYNVLLDTFSGSVGKVQGAYKDLLEGLGLFIVDNGAVIKGISAVSEIFVFLRSVIDQNADSVNRFVTIAVSTLLDATGSIIDGLDYLVSGFQYAAKASEVFANAVTSAFLYVKKTFSGTKEAQDDYSNSISLLKGNIADFSRTGGGSQTLREVADKFRKASSDALTFGTVHDKVSKAIQKGSRQMVSSVEDTGDSVAKLKSELEQLQKSLVKAGKTEQFVAVETYLNAVKLVGQAQKARIIGTQEGNALIVKAEVKLQEDLLAIKKKALEEEAKLQKERVDRIAGVDLAFAFGADKTTKAPSGLEAAAGIGKSVLSAIGQGAEGAKKLVASAIGTSVGTALSSVVGPVLGKILGDGATQFIELLLKPKEEIKSFFKDFVDVIVNFPTLLANGATAFIEALVENIPVIIEGLLNNIGVLEQALFKAVNYLFENMPQIISSALQKFLEGIPNIIERFAQNMGAVVSSFTSSLISQAPLIAISITQELIRNIPTFVVEAGKALADAVKEALKGIGGGIVKGAGGIVSSVGGAIFGGNSGGLFGGGGFLGLGLQQGGTIPPGFNNDSFPARLSSGENVVSRTLNEKLERFLSNQGSQPTASSSRPLVINIGSRTIIQEINDELMSGRVLEMT